jgi:Mg-dependent DNase
MVGKDFKTKSSSSSTTKTIMSMTTREQQQEESQQQQTQTQQHQRYPYPLIDVDCNLLHPDLMNKTLLVPTAPATAAPAAKDNPNDHDKNDNHHKTQQQQEAYDEQSLLWILNHPSTILSNIQGIFSPSSTLEEAERMYDLLIQHQETYNTSTTTTTTGIDIRMSVGVHPYHASGGSSLSFEKDNQRIRQLIQRDDGQEHHGGTKFITCIGETGLDYSEGFPCREDQIPWFRNQLELAKEYNLPLFLHERLAFDDTIRLMDEVFGQQSSTTTSSSEGSTSGGDLDVDPPISAAAAAVVVASHPKIIVHCFTGSKRECIEYVKRGYYLSVSGYICKSGEGPRQVQECLVDGIIPMEKLMIETDAPYMGFASCRDLFYQVESGMNGGVAFEQLSNKMKKRYLKGIYPNVPSSLPMVLECTVNLINEGRRQRGEDEIVLEGAAKMFHDNAVDFFGFNK